MNRILLNGLMLASAVLIGACQAQAPDVSGESEVKSETPRMTVYHDPNCGCCGKWVEHMRDHGFEVETVATSDMNRVKHELGVPRELPSCHTAQVGDYIIEGHVPAKDVLRLLAEAPHARGLSVPGMPIGSPGMEVDGRRMAYDVVLFGEDGQKRYSTATRP
ncbi:MAG: DUF411 domain-containing protein [Xanthomonadales bacterium]|nr:DUF411 domain-containing protein [Xanthomonadales bacterium]